jgi:serine/threonine protein kinase
MESVEGVCNLLARTRLLIPEEVKALRLRWRAEAGDKAADVGRFGQWLVAQQYLTPYQADRILRGQTDHYYFNEYKLLDRIGQGRMAGIYKGVHRLGQVVAIKVLPPSLAKDPQAFGRFQREARLALRLKHPNVVRTFQTGQADKLHFLVMEYLDGETLQDVLRRRKRLPPAEAARLIHQALLGLQHLHEQGMVHRDLKPANLMLVPAPVQQGPDTTLQATVKILDIGVGRALFDEGEPGAPAQQDLTNEGDLLGAPDYMAPEQAKDAHAADVRADIYSLGCVLYQMLTGQTPFPDVNPVQKIIKHATERPKPIKTFDRTLPDGLQEILDWMLAKDPAQRYPTPAQAAKALKGFLAHEREPERPTEAVVAARKRLKDYEAWLVANDPEVAVALPADPAELEEADETDEGSLLRRHPFRFIGAAVAAVVLVGLVGGLAVWLIKRPGGRTSVPTSSPTAEEGRPGEGGKSLEAWAREVAALPADRQPDAVAAKLRELNPGFDGTVQHKVEDGAVTELRLVVDNVTDLEPLRALPALKRLTVAGSGPEKGKLADLAPLRGLQLATLDCSSTRVADLAPLRGLPLCYLAIAGTPVRDLTPLKGMPLLGLNCAATRVKDLSPLERMELVLLDAAGAPVEDLTPLRGMPLLALSCEVQPERDKEVLDSLVALKEVNGKQVPPRAEEPADPDGGKKKPALTPRFSGKLVRVQGTEKGLTVHVTPAVVTQSAYHTYWLGWHRNRLLEALHDRDAGQRPGRVQEQVYWLAFHRGHLYSTHAPNQDLDLLADDDTMVRTVQPPMVRDDDGKLRPPTAKEREKLKGPDRTLPGYTAEFTALKPPQSVEVYIARGGLTKAPPRGTAPPAAQNDDAPEGGAVDHRPRVFMIVVQE